MNKYAILDIGTNAIKFFLFALEDGEVTTIIDTNNITRLGESLQKTGKISAVAMDRNIKALGEFLEIAKDNEVEEITAVGTMCLRSASNANEFIKKTKDELALDIQIISGEEEARLSYLAVAHFTTEMDKNILVFDTGGGSTEFIFGKGKKLIKKISLNIGAVQVTEEFLHSDPVTSQEVKNMIDYLKKILIEHNLNNEVDYIVGIGGTVTAMGAVMYKMTKYNPNKIQGTKLYLAEIDRQIELYSSQTIEERKKIDGLHPKRADVILAGAGIVKIISEQFKKDFILISDKGLRHGLMFDKYIKKGRNYAVII